jgi:oligopeptidase B
MSDESLPLTPPEWPEWGDPIRTREGYDWIRAYSPYDNIRTGVRYPPVLATGGLADYRVTYWEPAKWIARLRAEATGGPFLLRMNMEAGHAGAAARFEALEEEAHFHAFALEVLGLTDAEPVSHSR